ncbi:ATP-grasp domain-containing protein [Nordella sp. HKS 07]|uniref:ATP-grasp domain-containing protein n=1 Tax=Nordella sp. HKS 07 TaxID=2712222 RepID=UPI0013E17A96|nr:ATP-grasp domain-containing protein [Nordella sp. HKS 07]QIG52563.1 ATP-grasp domain-containing protein [Nordella sp. HKS 07]
MKIAVTGGGALLGQGILRALRRSSLQLHTVALDVSPLSAGLYWADEAYLVPLANAPDYLDAIRRMLAKVRPDVMLVGTDVELVPLAAQRAELEREFNVQILVSSPEVVAIADDKYQTARFFKQHDFAAPASALAHDKPGIAAVIAECGFPLIVKPCIGARSYGVSRADNEEQLQWALAHTKNAVVQECISDADGEFTASGLYFDGHCHAVIVMRRDLRDGNTYRAFTVFDAVLEAQVKAWTEALKPHGPANFQFRIDARGRPKVFEINGRFSGTTPLRAHAGFNEVEMCVRKLLWDEPIVQPEVKPITILRHWSETVIEPQQVDAVKRI